MASFGENLRRAREARNVTLQEIAVSTKISTRALQALENEQFELLPGGIFNRGFVRAYARCVGLNEEDTVAQYLAAAQLAPAELDMQTMSSQVAEGGARATWAPNAATLVGVLAVIVALGLAGLWLNEHRKAARRNVPVVQSTTVPAPAVQPTQAASQPNIEPQSAAKGEGLNPDQSAKQAPGQPAASVAIAGAPVATPALKAPPLSPGTAGKPAQASKDQAEASKAGAAVEVSISATARSWISVSSDGQKVETLTLDPEKPESRTRRYTAKQKLMLVVGNPGALSVTYNGKPTGSLGPSGQRATITFTPEGIEKQ